MATNLKLLAAQELELNSSQRWEAFSQDYEKQRAFQSQFEYKGKLLGLLKGIRTSLTPLFLLTDKLQSFKAKLKLFCGELGITLTELDGDESLLKGIGPDPHPIVLLPIVAGPFGGPWTERGAAAPSEGQGLPGPPNQSCDGQIVLGETAGRVPACLQSECQNDLCH